MIKFKNICVLAFFLSSYFSAGCVVLPVTEHWAGRLEGGKVVSPQPRCGSGSSYAPLGGSGAFQIILNKKTKQLEWLLSRGAFKSIFASNDPVVFIFKNGQRIEQVPRYEIFYNKKRPEDIYSFKDGYKISRNDFTKVATISKYEKYTQFGVEFEKLIEQFNYDYSSISEPLKPNTLQTVLTKGDRNIISVLAHDSIPMIEEDLEVQIPEIKINGETLPKTSIWFKYVDTWMLFPLNC